MRQPRLLIVSEDALLRAMISEWFTGAGFRVDFAQESEVAAELCEKDGYHAVIVDFDMAQVKAYETILFLRALGRDGAMIAMVSDPNNRLTARICGASSVLAKPVSMENLEDLVEDARQAARQRPVFSLLRENAPQREAEDGEAARFVPMRAMGGSG